MKRKNGISGNSNIIYNLQIVHQRQSIRTLKTGNFQIAHCSMVQSVCKDHTMLHWNLRAPVKHPYSVQNGNLLLENTSQVDQTNISWSSWLPNPANINHIATAANESCLPAWVEIMENFWINLFHLLFWFSIKLFTNLPTSGYNYLSTHNSVLLRTMDK